MDGVSLFPGSVCAPDCWALVGLNPLALEHEGLKGVIIGEVPVDVGLAHVREQLLQDDFPSLVLSRAPESMPHELLPGRTYPHVSCGRHDLTGTSRLVVRRSTGRGSSPKPTMRTKLFWVARWFP